MKHSLSKIPTKRKIVYVFGINDADYVIRPTINGIDTICQYYQTWHSMIRRCYSDVFHTQCPTYIGCTVCDEWLSFMAFRAWMLKQDWRGNALDKDIISPGNKHYSPENCVFVSIGINKLLTAHNARRGDMPLGVTRSRGKFMAQIMKYGKHKNLGIFTTSNEAFTAYNKSKSLHIIEIAHNQTDPRIRDGLLRHADLFKQGLVT